MVNQVRVFEPFCFLCVSVCLVCACVRLRKSCVCVSKIFVFVFVFRACRVKNEPTTTTLTFDDFDDFDKFDKGEKKAQKYKKRTKKRYQVSYLGIFFFKKLGALVYVQRIIHTERSVVQEGLGRNERFS